MLPLLLALASPLDRLDPALIHPGEHFKDQPKELVAVVGGARGHQWGLIRSLRSSPDGRFLITSSDHPFPGGEALLWDAGTLRRVSAYRRSGPVWEAMFAPDGKSVAIAS
ncbi:MAG: WD40 repeat domain-containing protein [Gemmataceae bacterium]|nr:WD40 repeat domain-containing protein [Gemmataceae bacterium]